MNCNPETMKGVETYKVTENGFHPTVIFNTWRFAVLNYCDIVEKNLVYRVEKHVATDEVFALSKGDAWLIICGDGEKPELEGVFKMEPSVVYNIPKNVWHHIVLTEDASVYIVENSDVTCDYQELSEENVATIKAAIDIK